MQCAPPSEGKQLRWCEGSVRNSLWPALLAHLLPNLLHRDETGCMGVTLIVGFQFLNSGSIKECAPYGPSSESGLGWRIWGTCSDLSLSFAWHVSHKSGITFVPPTIWLKHPSACLEVFKFKFEKKPFFCILKCRFEIFNNVELFLFL